MNRRTVRRSIVLLILLSGVSLNASPAGEMAESRWSCRAAGWVMHMHWREVSAAEGCDGEACRLVTEPILEGVLMTEQGRRVGVVEVRGAAKTGWRFRDLEGRSWHLRPQSSGLKGTVGSKRSRWPVACTRNPDEAVSSRTRDAEASR